MPARRRPNGEGSVYHRKDGRWCCYLAVAGRRIYHYARTQRECVAWLTDMRQRVADGRNPNADRLDFGKFLATWLDAVRSSLSASTVSQYDSTIRKHILPALGTIAIGKLRPDILQAWYSQIEKDGVGVETIHIIHAIIHRALNHAVKWQLLPRNPAALLTLPRAVRRQPVTLTAAQVRLLLDVVRGTRDEALIHLAVTTGMRHAELAGLLWSDVNWHASTISVQRQLKRDGHGGYVYTSLKTRKGNRLLPIGALMLAVLRGHRERQEVERVEAGDRWHNGNVIFATPTGKALPQATTLFHFREYLRRAGLPPMRFHDLRHTAATLMMSSGVHPKVVQERLGHATISMTLDTYSHVSPTLQREAADNLDALLAVT